MAAIREPHKIFATCLDLYRCNPGGSQSIQSSSVFSLIRKALEGYLSAFSLIHQGALPGWTADLDNPGYMLRFEPPIVMRAPYHLVSSFPSEGTLDAIWRLSRKIKTLPTSILCLSGSAAIIKSSVSICDIDFCEYIIGKPKDLPAALLSKTRTDSDVSFRRLRIGSNNFDRKADETEIRASVSSIDSNDLKLSHAKFDFVGKPEGMRPTEISNVIIFCDKDWNSASLGRSFAAQEAHLVPVVAMPKTLCEPYEMGRYIDYLMSQAHKFFVDQDYTKSIKRCLSLSMLCMLADISKQITNFIENSPDFLQKEISSIDKILEDIAIFDPQRHDWIENLVQARQDIETIVTRVSDRQHESIQSFCARVLASLDSALAGEDMKAA